MESLPARTLSKQWREFYLIAFYQSICFKTFFRKVNLHAMRMGPGMHLKGLFIIQPETFYVKTFFDQDGS